LEAIMNGKDDEVERTAQLRSRAEEIAQRIIPLSPEEFEALSPEETLRMIHELRVHQIELKMQNEELLRTQVELEATRARYFDLYNLAPVGYFIISREGLILEANLAAVTLLGMARAVLIKHPITRFILEEDLPTYYRHRVQLWETGQPDACELRMVRSDGTVFWVGVTATISRGPMTSAGQDSGSAAVSRVVLSDITAYKRGEKEETSPVVQLKKAKKRRPSGLRKKIAGK
jgi:PAS domain S-box-containing protein